MMGVEGALGEIGREWVQRNLERSSCLGPLLLPHLDLHQGECYVLGAKSTAPVEGLQALEHSAFHLNVVDLDDSASATLDLIRDLESKVGDVAIIVEANLLRPGDPAAHKPPTVTSTIVTANEVVFIREWASTLADTSELITLLSSGSGYPLNAFIMSGSVAEDFAGFVIRAEPKPLVAALLATIHSVYDSEGYVAWLR